MKFTDLDTRMRVFETAHDHCVMPDVYIVVRLDGRGFTRLVREVHSFEAPYDIRFRDYMLATVERLMNCGFNVVYGYTQSDEISLLFHLGEATFGRKERKINSVLAGEASSAFALQLGSQACFDSRVCQLPNRKSVVDYFRWRQEDAHRNALNSHCYWKLRSLGESAGAATNHLSGLSVSDKNELLYQNGINFNELPAWQKRGMGVLWENYQKEGKNPITGEISQSEKRQLVRNLELTYGDEYSQFISSLDMGDL